MPQPHPSPPTVPPAKASRGTSIAEVLSTVVLLGGPLFYVLGRVYWESYWLGLGVSPTIMAASTEDYIYYGFVVIANGIIMIFPHIDFSSLWATPLVAMVVLLLLAAAIWVVLKIRRWAATCLRKLRPWLRNFFSKRKAALEAVGTSATLVNLGSTLAMALLLISAALLFPIVIAHAVGKERAAKVRAQISATKTPYAVVQLKGQKASRLLECSDKFCVIYSEDGFRPVPIEAIGWLD